MRVAYIGNFGVSFSTESHVKQAMEANGWDVVQVQENRVDAWEKLKVEDHFDLVLWTHTGWDPPIPEELQRSAVEAHKERSTPIVGYHLDRWWGLSRQPQVDQEPFFRECDLMITADGGHQAEFEAAGIRHVWMPPGVSEFECVPGTPKDEYRSDIVFVGSWYTYHAEWRHRFELVRWLQRKYRRQAAFWPRKNEPAIREEPLRDLYASVKVCVGDSCLVGATPNYWSDRIPETLGRGGFLIHPWVDGLQDHFDVAEVPGAAGHLSTWRVGDWDGLRERIEYYLAEEESRRSIAEAGREHVLKYHTYTVRMRQLLELLVTEGMLVG